MGDLHSATMFPTEYLHSLKLFGLHEHHFKLKDKVNTILIFLRYMDIYIYILILPIVIKQVNWTRRWKLLSSSTKT